MTAARSGDTGAGLSPEHRKRRPRFPESSLLTRRQVCSGWRVGEDLGTRRASWGVGTEVWGAWSFLGHGDRALGCTELPGAWGQRSGVQGPLRACRKGCRWASQVGMEAGRTLEVQTPPAALLSAGPVSLHSGRGWPSRRLCWGSLVWRPGQRVCVAGVTGWQTAVCH